MLIALMICSPSLARCFRWSELLGVEMRSCSSSRRSRKLSSSAGMLASHSWSKLISVCLIAAVRSSSSVCDWSVAATVRRTVVGSSSGRMRSRWPSCSIQFGDGSTPLSLASKARRRPGSCWSPWPSGPTAFSRKVETKVASCSAASASWIGLAPAESWIGWVRYWTRGSMALTQMRVSSGDSLIPSASRRSRSRIRVRSSTSRTTVTRSAKVSTSAVTVWRCSFVIPPAGGSVVVVVPTGSGTAAAIGGPI